MKGWWCNRLPKLAYGDNRVPVAGIEHHVLGDPVIGKWGLHASKHPWDAIAVSNVTSLWLVEITGSIKIDGGQIVGKNRKYINGPVDVMPAIEKVVIWANNCVGDKKFDQYDQELYDKLLAVCKRKIMPGKEHISLAAMSFLACPNIPNAVRLFDMSLKYMGRDSFRDKMSHTIINFFRKQVQLTEHK